MNFSNNNSAVDNEDIMHVVEMEARNYSIDKKIGAELPSMPWNKVDCMSNWKIVDILSFVRQTGRN